MSLLEELKRRKVFRVVFAYAIGAWVVIQVADIATESFAAPEWVMKALILFLIAGFFVAGAMAWAFELTGEGMQRDRGPGTVPSAPTAFSQRWVMLILTLLSLVIAVLLYDRFGLPELEQQPVTEAAGEASVAVLPFTNMSTSEENEYFSDGLTDTLLHQLAQVKALKVAARTSSFAFKDTNTDIREIAQALGVDNVLEGSVQRSGNQVRITAQLIKAEDGYHIWSSTFDRNLDDIFAVQDEIAAQVASALTGSLLEASLQSTRVDGGTNNTEAYDLYLRAREAYFEGSERSLANSERLLRQALTLDPEFALAWAALTESILRYGTLAGLSWDDIDVELIAAADKAVELAPDNSITVGVKGFSLYLRGFTEEGRQWLERALELDPNNVAALDYLADAQFSQGEYRAAVETATRAMSLDPLDYALKSSSTYKFMQLGRIDEAEALAQAVVDHAPGSFDGLSALGNIYWRTGRFTQAYRTYFELLEHNPNTVYIYYRIRSVFEDLGDAQGSARWLDKAREINPQRARWTEAWNCWRSGQHECAKSIFTELLAENDPEVEDERSYHFLLLSNLARLEHNWPGALQAELEVLRLDDDQGNSIAAVFSRLRVVQLLQKMGRAEEQEPYLQSVESTVADGLANGSVSQYPTYMAAAVHALRGEAVQAAASLSQSIEYGYRDLPRLLDEEHSYFVAVLDHPAMVAVLEELSAINAAELQQLHKAVAELEGV